MATAGTRLLTISVGGTEYNMQVTSSKVTSGAADADNTTFSEAAAGGSRLYKLALTLLQDHATGTLWDKIWASAGSSAAVIVRPYGNTTPTVAQPHYTGNVTITEPDGDLIGGQANASPTARWTVDVEWEFASKPTKVTA